MSPTLTFQHPSSSRYILTIGFRSCAFPRPVGTVLRSELTEVERFYKADKVVYQSSPAGEEKTVVFKYPFYRKCLDYTWKELHIYLSLPPHPNILPLDRVVLDEVRGDRLIGYTTPFVPNGDLGGNQSRLFKLKYLKQLMQAVDDLNLKFGIMHQDILLCNLLIDPITDNLLLFDFNHSAFIGFTSHVTQERLGKMDPVMEDIRMVMFVAFCMITRHIHHSQDKDDIMAPDKWVKHPDAQLDHDVSVYYETLMSWVRKRRASPYVFPLLVYANKR